MIALLTASWGVLLKRLRADWLILTATGLTILLATTLLAAGPLYTESVTLAGLRRTLQAAPAKEANLAVGASLAGPTYAANDRVATTRLVEALGPTGGTIVRSGRSESFALPGQPANNVRDLAVFAFFEGIEQRATLVSGSWPSGASAPYAIAIPASVAEERGYRLNDEIQLESRLTPTFRPRVRIAGLYRVNDPADPYWFSDVLDTTGREIGQSFNTFGPFIVTQEAFLGPLNQNAARLTWRAYPDIEHLTAAELVPLRGRVSALLGRLGAAAPNTTFQVETNLPAQLTTAERSLLVTRSGVLIQLIQLAILAGYALVLTAGLLVEQRRGESTLLHARGVGPSQAFILATLEGLILAVPAALLAPWIALLSLRLLGVAGPLATLGPLPTPAVGRTAYLLSGGAALACIALLALPALGAARMLERQHLTRGRQSSRGVAQRAGIDLALLVLAAVAYWQLRRYGSPLTSTIQGRIGIDPLLAVAPGLGLLAGAVLALRVVPLLARAAEAVATGGSTTAATLWAWQVARRPQRYARAALLLILALGIGLFAAVYSRTWGQSQADQADYQVGADIRVEPSRRSGASLAPYLLPGAYASLPGVQSSMGVVRRREELSRTIGVSDVLLIDSAQAAEIIQFRPDLAGEPFAELLARLTSARPTLAVMPVPGEPRRLALDVRVARVPRPPPSPPPSPSPVPSGAPSPRPIPQRPEQPPAPISATVVIQDGTGMLYKLQLGALRADGQIERLTVPLAFAISADESASPAYPIAVVGFEIATNALRVEDQAQFDLIGLHASATDEGESWSAIPLERDRNRWQLEKTELVGVSRPPEFETRPAPDDSALAVRFSTGTVFLETPFPVTYSLRLVGSTLPPALPVLVDERLLTLLSSEIGTTLQVSMLGQRKITIVGTLRGFPTLDPNATSPFVVADLPTVAALGFAPGQEVPEPLEQWLAVAPDRATAITETLRGEPFNSPTVQGRADRTAALLADPLALGTIGALLLGFIAAALVAILGFALSAAITARERQAEFALLRALGLHPRQLVASLSLEQGITVALSLFGGLLLGLLLARLVLPLVSLTQAGVAAVPATQVIVPWLTIILLTGGVLLVLVGVGAILGMILRRTGLGGALRVAEE